MRLLRFYVRHHLLLHDLDLRFDRPGRLDTGQYALDFLVGVNGSGKSTLLRALTQTFANLRASQPNSFDFVLEYELGAKDSVQVVLIQYETQENSPKTKMQVKSGEKTIYESNSIDLRFLPRRVIVYSTGNEAEWARLLNSNPREPGEEDTSADLLADNIQRSIKELPGSMAKPQPALLKDSLEPPFWLMRNDLVPVTTLCGLLAHLANEQMPLKDVIDAIGIHTIPGFSLRFRLHSALSDKTTYEKLFPLAIRRLRQGADYLLYFDLSKELAGKVLQEFNGSFEFYRALDKLSNPNSDTGQPTLQQVNIFLQRNVPSQTEDEQPETEMMPGLFLLDWLSDGEQSFLGRMALIAMLDSNDSLILLDEPEVHFNDYWKREVVNLLDKVMSEHTNHLLITTHSSILLSDVTDDQITVLFKNEDGISQSRRPGIKTFGADPSEIMTVLFQAEIPSGIHSTDLLTVAVMDGDKETVQGYLQMVGPGMWRFRLRQRLGELNATSD